MEAANTGVTRLSEAVKGVVPADVDLVYDTTHFTQDQHHDTWLS